MRRSLLVTCICLLCALSFAQSFNFRNYNTEDGLPQSQVLCIYQDNNGYIWAGTNSGGVGRFDGAKFIRFSENEGLSNNVVYSICNNTKNELFFGTGKGLSVYDGFKFKNYDSKNGLTDLTVFKVLAIGNEVWLGTEKGVFVYKNQVIKAFDTDTLLNNSSVKTIFCDSEKNIWFGTFQNGVIRYNTKSGEFKNFTSKTGLNGDFIFSISQKKNGTMLIGTQTGLNYVSASGLVSSADEIPGNKNMTYSSIEPDESDRFYFGTYGEGLLFFDFESAKRRTYSGNNGLSNYPVMCTVMDREKNLWVGTAGSGMYKFNGSKFKYYTKENGLPEAYINAVCEDKHGNMWIAIQGNGIMKVNATEGPVYFKSDPKQKGSLPDINANAFLVSNEGRLYVGTNEGLCYYENGKFITVEDALLRTKYFISLYDGGNGIVWAGTTAGLYKFVQGKGESCEAVNSLQQNGVDFLIHSITKDKAGKLWLGTDNGVLVYDSKTVTPFREENGFTNGRVGTCLTDDKGNIWLGTEKGLYFYSGNKFEKIAETYGMIPSFINLLQIDSKKRLVIGTNNGIDILDLNEFYQKKGKVKHFGKEDGLLSLESNSNASALDSRGRVLIGTVNGLEIYDPLQDKENKNEPKTHITGIKLFFGSEDIFKYSNGIDSMSSLPKKLVLPYNMNNLSFSFDGICLTAPEKVKYQYKLEGIDKEWTPPILKNEITYPSLPEGTYTFCVKAMNNDGVWNKEAITFSFEILPPWYKTWWFYTLSAVLIISGITFYNNYRTKKLKADNLKLERTVDDRTKELRDEKEKVEKINVEVIKQKLEIEHKNVEITDSIKYAKNIQEALLPSLVEVEKAFDDCFVLYLPKDIVSGDFFWFHENEQYKYVAAADCTGHGVPGAFMSIVGNTLLNEIVEQKSAMLPGDILLELHKGVKDALSSSEKESQRRDGMDISLVALSKKGNKLEYAGANRPLWIYRKGSDLEIIKATKYPIGGLELEEERKYTNHSIEVNKGDSLYIFSDGFADQFGGPKGKKLMVANMQKVISENISLNLSAQKQKIKKTFEDWKTGHEQVDDVLVIGIRI